MAIDNLYQAPETEILPEDSKASARFYIISKKKFWILFLITSGLYSVYWFYKHWAIYKARTGEKMWPVMRAWFSIFFTHSLFGKFESEARMVGTQNVGSLSGIATLTVIFSFGDNVLGKLSGKGIGSPVTDILQLVLLPFIGLLLWKAQAVANLASGDEGGSANSKLTGANWFWIVVGVIIWCLIAFGLADMFGLIPEFE